MDMTSQRVIETIYAVALFAGYVALWAAKRRHQRLRTGHDPEVLDDAGSPLQRFFRQGANALTVAAVLILVIHGAGLPGPGFGVYAPFDRPFADRAGLAIGVAGLSICALAQWTMGLSWRVGIDEARPAPLVTVGIYRSVRNPTYLGLFLVDAGLWLIWPSAAVALFWLASWLLLEVQVRCEEEFLARVHGAAYVDYLARTWRYLPFVY